MNEVLSILSRLTPTLIIFAAALLIELLIPLHKQSRATLGRLPANFSLMAISLALGMFLNGLLAAGALYFADRHTGIFYAFGISGWVAALLTILILDVATYFVHVFLHSVPLFWRAHLIHHMDPAVDATTAFRQHPFEGVLRFTVIAFAAFSFGMPPEAIALYRLMGSINSIVEHSNIRLPRFLEKSAILFWVTPDMHKMHHSRERHETDSNYANLFSFVDRFFGTFTPTDRASRLRYGIDGFDTRERHSVWYVLTLPFRREAGGRTESMSNSLRTV